MFKRTSSSIKNLMELYRYISIFLTLFIYVVHGIFQNYNISVMLILVFCVIIYAFLFGYLYNISFGDKQRMVILLLLDIAGISFLILLTGGLDSSFIWCFLNPLLVISYYAPLRPKVLSLAASIMLLCIIGYIVEGKPGIRLYLLSRSNIILSFTLLLILVNILFYYSSLLVKKQKELSLANETLESYNRRIKGMTQDILHLYEAVQTISGLSVQQDVASILLEFAGKVFPEANAFYYLDDNGNTDKLMTLNPIDDNIWDNLVDDVKSLSVYNNTGAVSGISRKLVINLVDQNFVAVITRITEIKNYGVIGLLVPREKYGENKDEYESNLLLISQLATTFFEKIEDEAVGCELAVADEQNRIAEDIHDSVVQRLFAASCFIYDTLKKWNNLTDEQKKEQLNLIMETIRSSLEDLRSTIYNLSSKKQNIVLFRESLASYLDQMERLSGINIHLDARGDLDSLSLNARKAIYRIITECTGNAVKHAKCKNIWVHLLMDEKNTKLTIKDDGIGFDLRNNGNRSNNGLGLYNIKSLVRIYKGNLEVLSGKGSGSTFNIEFNNDNILKKPEAL
ncbi:MAG TPA: hypothetical protein GXX20_09595 [Clostridiaceae bacterium]|nr:hypothetical protein [Clostridiaceae bacterium]